jgi:hypothetical protein
MGGGIRMSLQSAWETQRLQQYHQILEDVDRQEAFYTEVAAMLEDARELLETIDLTACECIKFEQYMRFKSILTDEIDMVSRTTET